MSAASEHYPTSRPMRSCYRCGQPGTHFARIGSLGQREACERHAKGWPGWTPIEDSATRLLRDLFDQAVFGTPGPSRSGDKATPGGES